MFNATKILEQFIGSATSDSNHQEQASNSTKMNLPSGNFTGGALAGGLIGLLVGNKKARKMAGGFVGYGGAAAAGALAFKAYQNWQEGKQVSTAPIASKSDLKQVDPRFLLPKDQNTSSTFAVTLMTAMIVAANADGHIDAGEQRVIFDHVEKLSLDAESKAFVFDTLRNPPSLEDLTSSVQGIEQASEVYLVSRLVADGEHPAERIYLQALAHRLNLPNDLVAHLDHQVSGA